MSETTAPASALSPLVALLAILLRGSVIVKAAPMVCPHGIANVPGRSFCGLDRRNNLDQAFLLPMEEHNFCTLCKLAAATTDCVACIGGAPSPMGLDIRDLLAGLVAADHESRDFGSILRSFGTRRRSARRLAFLNCRVVALALRLHDGIRKGDLHSLQSRKPGEFIGPVHHKGPIREAIGR